MCLRAINLSGARGHRVLFSDVGLTLEAGQAVQLAGANGAGKTTLLKILCGLRRPSEGAVYWRDTNIHEQPAAFGQDLLYVGHENALNADLTAVENLQTLCRIAGSVVSADDVAQALRAMGLSKAQSNRNCRLLSAGQRRRVSLARLLLNRSSLWLLDEPAAALDVDARARLGERIAEHVRSGGAVLFTTHEPLLLPNIDTQTLRLAT